MIAHAQDHEIREHTRYLRSYARRHVRDRDLADDLVQDTLVAALASGDRFAGRSALRTWLVAILRHKILDAMRARRRAPFAYESVEAAQAAMDEDGPGAAESLAACEDADPERLEARRRFWEACTAHLERMPAQAARAFMLAEVLGHESSQVCAELGITDANLWTTLHRTRKRLREALETARPL